MRQKQGLFINLRRNGAPFPYKTRCIPHRLQLPAQARPSRRPANVPQG
jgi:hypothetical protein